MKSKWMFLGGRIVGFVAVMAGFAAGPAALAATAQKPNILFICSDQHAFNYAGFAGHPQVRTPNLDRLAREGTVFASTYAAAPVCVPSRAALMTGMYASDVGSYCNSTVWDGSRPVWAAYLQQGGYGTTAYGKLDLDSDRPMGFDSAPHEGSHALNPDVTSLFRMPLGYRVDEREQVDGRTRREYSGQDSAVTKNALAFLAGDARRADRPWLLYLGYIEPHPPFVALDKYYAEYPPDKVDLPAVSPGEIEGLSPVYEGLRQFKRIATSIETDKIRRARAGYYAMITELDEHIGRVIDALKASGQYENTLIIYTSDHGESLGDHGLWFKNNLYDCSVRVPLVMRGPGVPANRRVTTPVSQLDLTPTLLGAAGIAAPSYLRGKTLSRFFANERAEADNVVYAENHSEGNITGSFMIRQGDWKYIYFSYFPPLLFNLREDPGETHNLAGRPETAAREKALAAELRARVDPDAVTAVAFQKQKAILDGLVQKNSRDQLFDLFKKRLGEGQARELAARLKGEF